MESTIFHVECVCENGQWLARVQECVWFFSEQIATNVGVMEEGWQSIAPNQNVLVDAFQAKVVQDWIVAWEHR